MEAFGDVAPVKGSTALAVYRARTAGADASDTSSAPGGPDTTTLTRSSPRVRAMLAGSPSLFQVWRMEQEDRARGLLARGASDGPAETTRVLRPKKPRNKAKMSPHESDKDGTGGGSDDHAEDSDGSNDDSASNADASADGESAEDVAETQSRDQVQTRDATCITQVSENPIFSPPFQQYHEDWAAWDQYKLNFMRETHQVFVVRECINVTKRNIRLAEMGTPPEPQLTEDMEMYERIYVCTHGPKPKPRSRNPTKRGSTTQASKGKVPRDKSLKVVSRRPFRFIRNTDCPFRFRVQWFHTVEHGWRLQVKVTCLWHNHKVGPDVYDTYASSRGIKNPDNVKRAREMTVDGKKPAAVYDEMLVRGENVIKSDINNFMYAMRRLGADDNEAVVELLKKLREDDPDAVITVDETDRLETGVISITTKHMREMFSRFGELILVDCTHKTNRYNYQLCTIMVMDEFGCDQVVQQSLFETNGDWQPSIT